MAIRFLFDEKKTTQAAAVFIRLEGGKINYTKLIKLLYLADRDALMNWHNPITGDTFFSLPHGPVLSNTLDCITAGPEPENPGFWSSHIEVVDRYDVRVSTEPGDEELSEAEV
ncbi:MAG: Panacea domain-containing protein, partial [bacterium]